MARRPMPTVGRRAFQSFREPEPGTPVAVAARMRTSLLVLLLFATYLATVYGVGWLL